jgi:hypothetical protein
MGNTACNFFTKKKSIAKSLWAFNDTDYLKVNEVAMAIPQ